MNTTLEHKTKVVPTTATPEPLHPYRAKLIALLAEHEAVANAISDFEAKLSRSQLDLDRAIDIDADVDIERYQGQVSVYGLKISAKKSVLDRLLSSFPSVISNCANEYSTALLSERDRRASILAERIADTLQADKKRLLEGRFLDDVIDLSGPVQEIDRLRFTFSLINVSDETTLGIARHLLVCYDEILRCGKETV
jgi:hypothetical protein